jgi:hypothetical protein
LQLPDSVLDEQEMLLENFLLLAEKHQIRAPWNIWNLKPVPECSGVFLLELTPQKEKKLVWFLFLI